MREYWIGWSVVMLIVWVCILLVSLNPKDANAHLVFLACLSLAHIIVGICAVVNWWSPPAGVANNPKKEIIDGQRTD